MVDTKEIQCGVQEIPDNAAPGNVFKATFSVENKGITSFSNWVIAIRRSDKEQVMPLDWNYKETSSDPTIKGFKSWIYFYPGEYLAPSSKSEIIMTLEVSPWAKPEKYILDIMAVAYLNSESKELVATDWMPFEINVIVDNREIYGPEDIDEIEKVETPSLPFDMDPLSLIPKQIDNAWELKDAHKDDRNFKGYLEGAVGTFSNKDGTSRMMILNVFKFKRSRQAARWLRFEKIHWWNRHRIPEEVSEIDFKGQKISIWLKKNGLIGGWQRGNFVFLGTLSGKNDREHVFFKFVEALI